jgi:hypothetical protein
VGVGTSSPVSKFAVSGDGYITGGLGIGLVNTTAGSLKTSGSATIGSSLILSGLLNCNSSSQALQSDGSGIVSCGTITGGGSSSGGGFTWLSPNIVRLSTTTDLVGFGTTSPYAKLSINSGSVATTTLALVPVASQTANILDIYDTSGNLQNVFTASGNFGIGTTSPYAKLAVSGQIVGGYFTATTTATSTLPNLLSTNATTTSLAITGITSSLLKTNSSGSVIPAISGVDYLASYDGWTHPSYGGSATTSLLTLSGGFLSTASSTIVGNATTTGTQGVGALYLASDYITDLTGAGLSLSSGALGLNLANSNTWTGLQSFSNASTTLLSVTGTAYFGGTATSTFNSTGQLTLASTAINSLLSTDSSGLVVATSTPTFGNFYATSTTATSTIAGGFAVETNGLVYDYSTNNVGIGTASPQEKLSIIHSGNAEVRIESSSAAATQAALKLKRNTTGGTREWWLAVGDQATDSLGIYDNTSSASRLTINSSGNVGIGTTTPQWLLNPQSSTAPQLSLSAGAGLAQWAFRNAGGNFYLSTTTVAGTATTSTSALTVLTSNGNVGIGTTGPTDKLQVSGNVMANAFNAIGTVAQFNSTGGVYLSGLGGSSYGAIQSYSDAGGTARTLALNPVGGNVGIGTTTPGYKLSVAGSGFFDGGTVTASQLIATSSISTPSLTLSGLAINSLLSTDSSGLVVATSTPTFGNFIATSTTATSTIAGGFAVGTSQFVVQQNSGNVGIGNSNPTAKLYLSGSMKFAGGGQVISVDADNSNIVIAGGDPNSVGYGGNIRLYGASHATNPNVTSILTGGTERLRVDGGGNIGVGTTTPWGQFSINPNALGSGVPEFVVGSSTATHFAITGSGLIQIGGTSSSFPALKRNGTALEARLADDSGYTSLTASSLTLSGLAINSLLSTDSSGLVVATSTPTFGNFIATSTTATSTISTGGFAVGTSQFVVQQNSGNVGIGTTTPASKLDVALGTLTYARFDGNANDANIKLNKNGIGNYYGLQLLQGNTEKWHLGYEGGTNTTGSEFIIYDSGTPRLTIQNGGNIGIGTTTPQWLLNPQSSTAPQLSLSAGAGLAQWAFRNAGGDLFLSTTTVAGTATTSTAALSIAGGGFGTTTLRGLNISGQATSTSNVGFNITTGCFAVSGVCVGSSISVGSTIGSATAGSVLFAGASGALTQDNANFYFDDTNNRLGLGTTTPFAKLSVNSVGGEPAFVVGSSTATSLIVDFRGNVGVNVNNPVLGGRFQVTANDTDTAALVIHQGATNNPSAIQFSMDGASSAFVQLTSSYQLGWQASLNPYTDDNSNFTLGTGSKRWYSLSVGTGASSFAGDLSVGGALNITGLATMSYSSSTAYSSFQFASSTREDIGTLNLPSLSQGALYVGSGSTTRSVATSTITVGGSLSYSGTMGSILGGSSGILSLNTANPNTWTGLQSFSNASTTLLSVTGTAYFGGTATSTFNSTGQLTLASTAINSLLSTNSAGLVVATSTPTFGNFYATSTTATSTISTGGLTVGTSQFIVQQNSGNIGIGTTTPQWLLNPSSATAPQLSLSAGAGLAQWAFRNAGGDLFLSTTTVAGTATTSISALTISGSGFGTTTVRGLNISGQATTTSNVGVNITGGCYAVSGNCLQAFTNTLSSGGTATTTFYSGGVLFSDSTKLTQSSSASNFFWDETNKRLGLGTSTPFGLLSLNPNGITGPEFIIGSSTKTDLIVTNAGLIGIGTSTPTALLALQKTANSSDLFKVSSTTGATMLTVTQWGGFLQNISSSTAVNIQDGSSNQIFTVDTTQSSTNAGLDITAGGSQTGNLLNLYSSAGTLLTNFTAAGGLQLNIASTTALNIMNGVNVTKFNFDTTTGRFGIGTTSAGYPLHVEATSTSDYIARIYNADAATTADGLLISLAVANGSRTTGNYFIGFSDGAGTVAGKIQGGASAVAYTTTAADLAEFFPVLNPDDKPKEAEVVALDQNEQRKIKKADGNFDEPFGIVSTNPGFVGNAPTCPADEENCDKNYEKYNSLVTLTGQVPVKVSLENGPVFAGDYLTVSKTKPGFAAKAIESGNVIGQALTNLLEESNATSTLSDAGVATSTNPNPTANTVLAFAKTEWRNIGNVFVVKDKVLFNASSTQISSSSPMTFLINQKGSGDLLNLQKDGVTRLLVSNSGAMQILSNASVDDKKDVFVVKASDSNLLSINSRGDVKIRGTIQVSKNTSGSAKLVANSTEVEVVFDVPYDSVPKVVVTPQKVANFFYAVTDKTVNGFKIKTNISR